MLAVSPEVKVLILTTFEQDDYIFGAINAGASGERILMKLQLRDRIHAVIFGYESGLNDPGSRTSNGT